MKSSPQIYWNFMLIHWLTYFGIYNMHIDHILKIFLSNGIYVL